MRLRSGTTPAGRLSQYREFLLVRFLFFCTLSPLLWFWLLHFFVLLCSLAVRGSNIITEWKCSQSCEEDSVFLTFLYSPISPLGNTSYTLIKEMVEVMRTYVFGAAHCVTLWPGAVEAQRQRRQELLSCVFWHTATAVCRCLWPHARWLRSSSSGRFYWQTSRSAAKSSI